MSYVRTSTGNPLGRRNLAVPTARSRLGYYMRARFPLPTTSLSRPIRTRGLGWDNAPYPLYRQPERSRTRVSTLSGEYIPPGPPPRALASQGTLSYRIDPATGKYRVYAMDILPRGVFQQNTFQPPAAPALSALGIPMRASGQQLVQIGDRTVMVSTSPRRRRRGLKGLGCACKCGGACKSGLAADECSVDSDCGLNAVCGAGFCYNTWIGTSTGTTTARTPSNAPIQVVVTLPPQPTAPAPATSPSWFSGSTMIGGAAVPNVALAGGAALLALAAVAGGKRR